MFSSFLVAVAAAAVCMFVCVCAVGSEVRKFKNGPLRECGLRRTFWVASLNHLGGASAFRRSGAQRRERGRRRPLPLLCDAVANSFIVSRGVVWLPFLCTASDSGFFRSFQTLLSTAT